MTDQFVSIEQAARETRESIAVWRKRILRREIEYHKLGRNVRISRETLQRWIAARVVVAGKPERKRW